MKIMTIPADLKEFLLNISPHIFLEINSSGQIVYAGSKAQYIFALTNTNKPTIFEIFPKKQSLQIKEHLEKLVYQQYPEKFSLEFKNRNYNVLAYPFHQDIVLLMEDITEKRQLSHLLYQVSARLEFAEKTAHLGYWELDLSNKKFYWSKQMYHIFGVDANTVSCKRNLIREQILFDDLKIYKEQLSKLIKEEKPVEGKVRILKPNGKIAYCQFKAGIIFRDFRKNIAGTFQDITTLVETQIAYQKAKQEAEANNMAKSYFIAQASHDLRQPMQALNIFIENLGMTELSALQTEILKKIQESSNNLKNMLDNLLDISKLDSNGMEYLPQTFNLSDFLCRLCQEYKNIAQNKGICLQCNIHNIQITTDTVLLERIIRNLMSNALKYTKNKIKISAVQHNEKVYIFVIDNGIGIKQEEIPYIFDEFFQSRFVSENRRNGAGLGLSIVKKIASRIEAKIKVKSVLKKFTCFTIILDLSADKTKIPSNG